MIIGFWHTNLFEQFKNISYTYYFNYKEENKEKKYISRKIIISYGIHRKSYLYFINNVKKKKEIEKFKFILIINEINKFVILQ